MVEMFHLGQFARVRPVVRSFKSLARLSRFALDCRIADAQDASALTKAFEGCDTVVNSAVGDETVIEGMIEPVWNACVAAGVRRLIYLSSASVHGQAPATGTTETAPLSDKQWNWYNNAKVRAEWKLEQLRRNAKVQTVVLRPSIVFGPRSRWIWDAAKAITNGTAALVNEGRGICNSIYVDNLVHAARLAIDAPSAANETFLVGDEETVTWREFYQPIAEHFGVHEIPSLPPAAPPEPGFNLVDKVRGIPGIQKALPIIPSPLKRAVKGAWEGWSERPRSSPWKLRSTPRPALSAEMNALQQCAWHLPHAKAARLLDYKAPVPFAQGMERSIAWLDFMRFGSV